MTQLKWHGKRPPGDSDTIDLLVLEDIQRNLRSLPRPSDLITHSVFLGENYEGPSVAVWGECGDDEHFHCKYYEKTEWISA